MTKTELIEQLKSIDKGYGELDIVFAYESDIIHHAGIADKVTKIELGHFDGGELRSDRVYNCVVLS